MSDPGATLGVMYKFPHTQLDTPGLDPVSVGLCFLGLETLQRLGLAGAIPAAEIVRRLGRDVQSDAEAEDLRVEYMLLVLDYVTDGMKLRLELAKERHARRP